MDYSGLHAAAKRSLADCPNHPSRLTLWYLLILYGLDAGFGISLTVFAGDLAQTGGFQALDARGRLDLYRTLVAVLFPLLASVWSVGYESLCLKIGRGRQISFGDLAAGFRAFGSFLVLELLKTLFIALWSFLFVIPGVVAFYRYRLAEKILLDQPELSPMEALRESTRLTAGHKLELFLLDLTFWLHYLIVFALEFLPEALAEQGLLPTTAAELGCSLACTAVLLLVELHKLPLVQTTYARAYDWILSRDL